MKQIEQYLLAFGMAFMIFAAMMISENAQFRIESRVQNPFSVAQALDKKIQVSEKEEKTREVFTPDAELMILYPGTNLDFSDGNREIISGELFASFYMINQEDFQKAEALSNNSDPFSWRHRQLLVGQMKVGPLLINAPGANIFLKRDSEQGRSQIYAFGHSVEVYFEGAIHPFVIPSGMMIEVRESLVSIKTASLYHSKLKKEFRMRPFDISLFEEKETNEKSIEQKITWGLQRVRLWENRVYSFAQVAPESWGILYKDTWGSHILSFLRNIQNKWTIGMPQKVKDQRSFQELLTPFVRSHFLVKERKTLLAERSLQEFALSLEKNKWEQILQRNESLSNEWNNFLSAHIAFLRGVFPGDAEEIFVDFWMRHWFQKPFRKIERSFSNIERLFANKSYRRAAEEFQIFHDLLSEKEIEPEHRFEITKMRRLLVEILKREPFFQTEELFDLHRFLIEKELALHEDPEFQSEIRLESGQDVLYFLSYFLEDKSKINISRILLKSYEQVNIPNVVVQLGREIFTEEENELIEFITLIGNAGMTKEELDAIKDAKVFQNELEQRIQAVRDQKPPEKDSQDPSDPFYGSATGNILNAKSLKDFLEEKSISTSNMKFSTNPEQKKTEFSSGRWNGKEVSGVFHYGTQLFPELQVGSYQKEQLHTRFVNGFLSQIETKEASSFVEEESNTPFISQTTPRAILERKLVQEILSLEGFQVSLPDIQILDAEMEHLSISKATLNNRYRLTFEYDRPQKAITKVAVSFSENMLHFGNQLFDVEGAAQLFQEKIEAYIQEQKD